jgi:hypothetical protein
LGQSERGNELYEESRKEFNLLPVVENGRGIFAEDLTSLAI